MDMGEIKYAQVNGNRLAYFEQGEGPLVICLHGFPDTAHTWRFLMPALAKAGFRAVAPFLRGYAPTDIPADGAYQIGALISDVNALHEALGGDANVMIVGNDYGALVMYGALAHSPQKWRRGVSLAVPPHAVLGEAFLDNDMMKRIFYIFMLQTDFADAVLKKHGIGFLKALWRDWSPGFDFKEDLGYLSESLKDPKNLEAITKGYFRARMGKQNHLPKYETEQAALDGDAMPRPILYLHGRSDGVVPVRLIENASAAMINGGRMKIIDHAGHFLQLEQPDEVNHEIISWLRS